MPAAKCITPLLGGSYYHIFNRGINRQNIFFEERNYYYFLQLVEKFLNEYVSILAYCLLPNHFHFVIKIKNTIQVPLEERIPSFERDGIPLPQVTDEVEVGKFVSNQFRRLFITYTMAINKQESRTGSLFDKNFKRLEITENEYLLYSIFYAHYNPVKHGLFNEFRKYKFSSYSALLSNKPTKVARKLVFEIFDGKDSFVNYHSGMHDERAELVLE